MINKEDVLQGLPVEKVNTMQKIVYDLALAIEMRLDTLYQGWEDIQNDIDDLRRRVEVLEKWLEVV